MKKHIIFWAVVCTTIGFFLIAEDPVQTILNFVIGGVIPGVDVTLGFLPSLLVIGALVILARLWIRDIRIGMVKRATELNKLESQAKEFNQQHTTEVKKDHSAIAARVKKPVSL